MRPLLLPRCLVVVVSGICLSAPAVAANSAPALPKPYAGYDVVFAPSGHPVLGPEAAEPIERLLGKQLGPCATGDIQLGPNEARVSVRCDTTAETWTLRVRDPAVASSPARTTDAFVVMPPAPECDAACAARRDLVTNDVVTRLRQGEAAIPWQRVRALPGTVGGELEQALTQTQAQLAIGDRPAAQLSLQRALKLRRLDQMTTADLFDLALLAHEARSATLFDEARRRLDAQLAHLLLPKEGPQPGLAEGRNLLPATLALAGEATRAVAEATACLRQQPPCDAVPTVRALAAMEQLKMAGELLDAGPLAADRPPRREWLILRSGLASAQNDAATVQRVARRVAELWPDDPGPADVTPANAGRAEIANMPADATLLTAPRTPHGQSPKGTDQPWLPIVLLVATAAALALRWWNREEPPK